VKSYFTREPFEVSPETDLVRALNQVAAVVLGRAPVMAGQTPWMDAALLAAAGIETVVMGPAGGGAHAHEEWVDVGSAVKLAEILAGTAARYCRGEG
jgi:acetylornithine deacetylase